MAGAPSKNRLRKSSKFSKGTADVAAVETLPSTAIFTTAGCTDSTMSAKLAGAPERVSETFSTTLAVAAAEGAGPVCQKAAPPKTIAASGSQ
jgi:hypothetical protein